ncbi:MAG: molybdenum cofactor guanylyltransferase [Planctomycetes bacterium]|nr:molybdenum cofactor guanylyltransferase [Planctomycetota bacterium]
MEFQTPDGKRFEVEATADGKILEVEEEGRADDDDDDDDEDDDEDEDEDEDEEQEAARSSMTASGTVEPQSRPSTRSPSRQLTPLSVPPIIPPRGTPHSPAASEVSMVTGVILAGGRSRRMGADKAFLRFGPTTLLERQLAVVGEFCRELLVSVHDTTKFAGGAARVVPDALPIRAALVGIYSALAVASDPWCFATACDMPFVDPALARHLEGLTAGGSPLDLVIPRWRGILQPLHAWYARSGIDLIRARLDAGDAAIVGLVPALRSRVVEIAGTPWEARADEIFWSLNTPDDLERARARAGAAPPP